MPNSRQVSPDPVDEERENSAPNNNNNMENEAIGIGQPMIGGVGVARRDENSISFRHFLQPHSDVVPSPAPTCRNRNRGTQSGSVDLVDMAMALPDFVQDHLVVESLAIAEQQQHDGAAASGASSLDLNILNEILPDFATSQSAHSLPPQGVHARRRNIPEEQAAPPEVAHGTSGSSTLPDFLSDGPMQCTDSNVDNAAPLPSSSRSASRLISSNSLSERNRLVEDSSRSTSFDSSETLRTEVERLRREVAERNRRISQLENEILRLRTNTSTLEAAVRTAEQNALESEARRIAAESRVESLRSVAQSVACSSSASGDAAAFSVNGVSERFDTNALEVRDIAQTSEALLSQLLQNMSRLKGLASSSHRTEEHKNKTSESKDSSKPKH